MAATSDNRQPWARNQTLVAVLVILLVIAVGLGLYFALHKSSKGNGGGTGTGNYKPVVAQFMSASRLHLESLNLKVPIYWAGALKGYKAEFRRTKQGNMFVRYLPAGLHVGANGTNFEIIATYPFPEALNGLKAQAKQAGGKVVSGPGGSSIYVDPKHPKSVYMAWPNVDYQIEVYDPSATQSAKIAHSGKIKRA